MAAHQQATSEWWVRKREGFELFVSQLVIQEASAGDEAAAARRLTYLEGIALLDLTEPSVVLAESLLSSSVLPREAEEDALHIDVAAVHGMDYLLTWNCRHIANATMRNRIDAACSDAGYDSPVICTPEELLEE